jgi:hypothetical protein
MNRLIFEEIIEKFPFDVEKGKLIIYEQNQLTKQWNKRLSSIAELKRYIIGKLGELETEIMKENEKIIESLVNQYREAQDEATKWREMFYKQNKWSKLRIK